MERVAGKVSGENAESLGKLPESYACPKVGGKLVESYRKLWESLGKSVTLEVDLLTL